MKKTFVIIIFVILSAILTSGCLEEKSNGNGNSGEEETLLIEILNYNFNKQRYLHWEEKPSGWMSTFDKKTIVDWDLNISDINTNLDTRKNICKNYIATSKSFVIKQNGEYESIPGTEAMIWEDDYWGYSTISDDNITKISNIRLDDSVHSIVINGSAKNVADRNIDNIQITANLYNSNNNLLDSVSKSYENKSSGTTWDFYMTYNGEYKVEVEEASFSTEETT